MVRRYSYWFLVVALVLAVLAVPDSRRVFLRLARHAPSGSVYPGSVFDQDCAALEASIPGMPAWERCIALAELGPHDSPYLDSAIKAGTDRPETYAEAVQEKARAVNFMRREDYDLEGRVPEPYLKFQDADPKTVTAVLDLCRRGSRVDPDNAYFDLMAAYALFGAHRDAEALDSIATASRKRRFDSYRHQAAISTARYLERSGYPRLESDLLAWSTVELPHLRCMRALIPFTIWHARDLESRNRHAEARELLTALFRAGSTMHRTSHSYCERSIGYTLQHSTGRIEPRKPESQTPTTYDRTHAWRLSMERTTRVLRKHGMPELAAAWESESRDWTRERTSWDRYGLAHEWVTLWLGIIFTVAQAAHLSLWTAALCLLAGVIMWLPLRALRHRHADIRAPGWLWKACLLVSVPLVYVAGRSVPMLWGYLPTHGDCFEARTLDLPWVETWRYTLAAPWLLALALLAMHALQRRREGASWRGIGVLLLVSSAALALPVGTYYLAQARGRGPIELPIPSPPTDTNMWVIYGVIGLTALVTCAGLSQLGWVLSASLMRRTLARLSVLLSMLIVPVLLSLHIAVMSEIRPMDLFTESWKFVALVAGAALILVRVLWLQWRSACPSWLPCLLHTVRQGAVWTGKSLLLLSLLLLLVQLPFRAKVTPIRHAWLMDQVQVMEDWSRHSQKE